MKAKHFFKNFMTGLGRGKGWMHFLATIALLYLFTYWVLYGGEFLDSMGKNPWPKAAAYFVVGWGVNFFIDEAERVLFKARENSITWDQFFGACGAAVDPFLPRDIFFLWVAIIIMTAAIVSIITEVKRYYDQKKV